MAEQFHPNWRALATVPFQRKVFVRASNEDIEKKAEAEAKARKQLVGSEVRAFYESVTSEPPSKKAKTISTKDIKIVVAKKQEDAAATSFHVRESDLFRAAQNDDIDYVTKALRTKPDLIDIKDSYGWSLLMTGSKAGSVEVLKFLLLNKADTSVVDKAGNSCLSLAKNDLVKDLFNCPKKEPKDHAKKVKRSSQGVKTSFKCDLCEIQNMTEESYNAHMTSILHQFKETGPNTEQKVHYVIPEANKGFQIMLNTGWESNKGLGPPGRSGKLYPVKTVLKRDRHGLGLHETKPSNKKVTHFQPFDTESVKNPNAARTERSSTVSKKLQEKLKTKETLKEVDFRREFL